MMKTLVCTQPGEFRYQDGEQPLLKEGQAIIRIRRIGICGTDLHAYEGTQPFFEYPRILGHELAGELVAVDGADDFTLGERVTLMPYFFCGVCMACRSGLTNCCSHIKVCGLHCKDHFVENLLPYAVQGFSRHHTHLPVSGV